MAIAGLLHTDSCPTSSKHCSTQPTVPSPPQIKMRYSGSWLKACNLMEERKFKGLEEYGPALITKLQLEIAQASMGNA